MGLPEVCVVYVIRSTPFGDEVLLGRKKTGLGKGKLVGPGGKLEAGESSIDAAVREVREEVGLELDPRSLTLIGELTYPFPHRPEWSQKSWAYLTRDATGVARESDELAPEWHPVLRLPTDEMWDDAKFWLANALAGAPVRATFEFGEDGHTVVRQLFEGAPG